MPCWGYDLGYPDPFPHLRSVALPPHLRAPSDVQTLVSDLHKLLPPLDETFSTVLVEDDTGAALALAADFDGAEGSGGGSAGAAVVAAFSHPRDASLAEVLGTGSPRSRTSHARAQPGDILNTPLNEAELALMFQAIGGRAMPSALGPWKDVAVAYDQLVMAELHKPDPRNVSCYVKWAGRWCCADEGNVGRRGDCIAAQGGWVGVGWCVVRLGGSGKASNLPWFAGC